MRIEYLHTKDGWKQFDKLITILGIPQGCLWWIGYESLTFAYGVSNGSTVVAAVRPPGAKMIIRVRGQAYLPLQTTVDAVDQHLVVQMVSDS